MYDDNWHSNDMSKWCAVLLPPPRRLRFTRRLSVCLSVSNFTQKLLNGSAGIFTRIVYIWTRKFPTNFGSIRVLDADLIFFSKFLLHWKIGQFELDPPWRSSALSKCSGYCCSCSGKSADNSETVDLSTWRHNTVFSRRQPSTVLPVDRLSQWNHRTRSCSYHQ